ncbi:hypothetical protein HY484_03710 [Candidatus Woesearchaeota archaeon]|nr:hypothetical protein [Candidatus Woesearchaeota archaeon]
MDTKTVKISAENYKWICSYAGELQKELGEPISVDRALGFLANKTKLSDLAGAWTMSDKEAATIMKNLRKGWSTWKIKSA